MTDFVSQIALPLAAGLQATRQIVIGSANAHVARALEHPGDWPFRTAVLTGPPRSGKSLFARWFSAEGKGEALDDAQQRDETDIFHRWNRAQESGTALLIIGGTPPWDIALPDLRSRLGAALQLEIGTPDDAMAADLLMALAQQRGLPLGLDAADYLIPRAERSAAELERLVEQVDILSLERKAPPTLGIWRAALEAVQGPEEPRLL